MVFIFESYHSHQQWIYTISECSVYMIYTPLLLQIAEDSNVEKGSTLYGTRMRKRHTNVCALMWTTNAGRSLSSGNCKDMSERKRKLDIDGSGSDSRKVRWVSYLAVSQKGIWVIWKRRVKLIWWWAFIRTCGISVSRSLQNLIAMFKNIAEECWSFVVETMAKNGYSIQRIVAKVKDTATIG